MPCRISGAAHCLLNLEWPPCLPNSSPADDFIDELASDGIELILANPAQQVGSVGAKAAGRAHPGKPMPVAQLLMPHLCPAPIPRRPAPAV